MATRIKRDAKGFPVLNSKGQIVRTKPNTRDGKWTATVRWKKDDPIPTVSAEDAPIGQSPETIIPSVPAKTE